MGRSESSSQPKPPPQPVIQYDPVATAAENALATAAKQSYASSVETEEERRRKSQLGLSTTEQSRPRRETRSDPAAYVPAGGVNASAVLTG